MILFRLIFFCFYFDKRCAFIFQIFLPILWSIFDKSVARTIWSFFFVSISLWISVKIFLVLRIKREKMYLCSKTFTFHQIKINPFLQDTLQSSLSHFWRHSFSTLLKFSLHFSDFLLKRVPSAQNSSHLKSCEQTCTFSASAKTWRKMMNKPCVSLLIFLR